VSADPSRTGRTDLRRELEASIEPLATSLDGRAFTFEAPVPLDLQTGGYVRIETDAGPALGQVLVRELARREGPEVTESAGAVELRHRISYSASVGSGTLLGAPAPFHDAPLAPAAFEDVASWLESTRSSRARLSIGEALYAPGVGVELDAGGFDRHTFLCGQSGSGKSYSLGAVLEQLLLETDLRIIVLDPNSDCVRLGETRPTADADTAARWARRAERIRVRTSGADGDSRLRLRFFDLSATTQAALAGLDPLRDRDEYASMLTLVEEEARGRSLDELRELITDTSTPEVRGLALRLRNLGLLEWTIWTGSREDAGVLGELDEDDWRCLVVDLGSVVDHRERTLVAAAVLERLWERRADRRPILLVVDEAHNVCPQEPGDELTALATDLSVRIAAEGRKFGLYMLVSTQRPQKVHENVLSQCDNLLLMRMNSPGDIEHLASLFSYAPASLLARSGVLRQGEALVAGKVVPHPVFVRFGGRVAEEGGGDVPAVWADPRAD